MPEEGTGNGTSAEGNQAAGTLPPDGTTGTGTPQATGVIDYINEDGTFKENWQNILDEDIREEKSLKDLKSLQTLAKRTVHATRMVGKDKITLPNENSTEDEKNEFFKAIGRPDTPEDYNFTKPENLPEEYYDVDFANEAKKLFHSLGIPKNMAEAIFRWNSEKTIEVLKQNEINEQNELEEKERALKDEWGNAYDQKVHIGNLAIEEGVGDDLDLKQRIVDKYGSEPDFIHLMVNLGSKFVEHGTIKNVEIPTPADFDEEISKLMNTDAYMNKSNPEHKLMVRKVQNLFEAKNKVKK